jgi:glutathione peroxidase
MRSFVPALALLVAPMYAASVYDFELNTIDGKKMPLSAYKGKVVLLVNTASR